MTQCKIYSSEWFDLTPATRCQAVKCELCNRAILQRILSGGGPQGAQFSPGRALLATPYNRHCQVNNALMKHTIYYYYTDGFALWIVIFQADNEQRIVLRKRCTGDRRKTEIQWEYLLVMTKRHYQLEAYCL